jgi:methionyl aminopeptidase
MSGRTCGTPGCDKDATLQCPTCIKLNIQGSFFCSQPCFKGSWDVHKAMHKLAKGPTASQSSKPGKAFNPWPGYMFTGKLRPAEQSQTRTVPDHIPRPDYADHPEGFPLSEQKLKGNTYIRQLDDEEIESKLCSK